MAKTSLQQAILETLSYSDIFAFPLSPEEVHQRLVKIPTRSAAIPLHELKKSLRTISSIETDGRWWCLKGRRKNFSLRKKREHWAIEKEKEYATIARIAGYIPTIVTIYITGSMAVGNPSSSRDDIDICIITQPDTLWITRLIVIGVSLLLGKYRLHNTHADSNWCFNLWLEKDSVTISSEHRSLYTAYEVFQAKPIYGDMEIMYSENTWVNQYLHHFRTKKLTRIKNKKGGKATRLMKALNYWAFRIQQWYMHKRKTIERVEQSYAFFHPRDTQRQVLKKYQQTLSDI